MRTFLFVLCVVISSSCMGQSGQGSLLLDAVKRNELKTVQDIVSKGADLNVTDENQATPLMWAAYNNNFELFRYLVGKGADHKKKGAIKTGNDRYLGSIINIAAALNDTVLLSYCLNDLHIPVTDKGFIIKDRSESGYMAIHVAAMHNRIAATRMLLQHGAPINTGDDQMGMTPLMLFFEKPTEEYFNYLTTIDSIDIARRDKNGLTVFHYVSLIYNNADIINLFLQASGNVNDRTNDGATPLMLAAFKGQHHSVTALLNAGADPSLKNDKKKTAFDIAMDKQKYETAFLIRKKMEGYTAEKLNRLNDSISQAIGLRLTADSLQKAGNITDAEKVFIQSGSLYASIFGKDHPACMKNAYELGVFYFDNKAFYKAVPVLQTAVSNYRRSFPEISTNYTTILIRLAVSERSVQMNDSALRHFRTIMNIHEKLDQKLDSNYLLSAIMVPVLLVLKDSAAEAWKVNEQAQKLMEENQLTKSYYYIQSLNNAGTLNTTKGNVDTGWLQLEKATTLCREVLGESNIAYVSIRSSIILRNISFKEYTTTIPEIKKHISYLKSSGLTQSEIYGTFLIQLAQCYAGQNLTDEAVKYTDSAALFYKGLPYNNPTAQFQLLLMRGEIEKANQNYDAAIRYFNQAIEVTRPLSPGKNNYYYKAIAQISEAHRLNGNINETERINLELLDHYRNTEGESDLDRAGCLNNLAMSQSHKGNFNKSIGYLTEAIEVFKKINNGVSFLHATGLNNLGQAYVSLGLSEKAYGPLENAIQILESVPGEHDQMLLTILNNLALQYANNMLYRNADSLLTKALKIANSLKKEPQEFNTVLCNLGTTNLNIGKMDAARALYYRVLHNTSKTGSKDNFARSIALINLGDLHARQNRYDSAKYYIRSGIDLMRSASMENNPIYYEGKILYAITLLKSGEMKESAAVVREVIAFYQNNLKYTSSFLGTSDISDYLNKTGMIFGIMLSVSQHDQMAEARNDCLNFLLALKGLALKNRNDLTNAVKNSKDKELHQLYDQFMAIKQKVSQLYAGNAGAQEINEAQDKFSRLEEELIRRSPEFQREVANRNTDWKKIQGKLKPGEAALEFIDTHNVGFQVKDSVQYAVYIVRTTGQPQLLTLCRQDELELRIDDRIGKRPNYVKELYDPGSEGGGSGNSLYQLIWKPLDSALKGINTIYYAPSGLLHRINFSAITAPSGAPLGAGIQFHLMGSVRDVASYGSMYINAATDSLLIMGGIRYDTDSASSTLTPRKLNDDLELARRSADFKDLPALPFSEKEVLGIGAISQKSGYAYRLLKTGNATEDSLRYFISQKRSPGIVHLSTHGFFVPDAVSRKSRLSKEKVPYFVSASNIFFRSGIFFAGVNQVLQGKRAATGDADGVITAYDITNFNLYNTKLLVLSSCESGVGKIDNIEGVFGLQRAVRMAGCRNLIMSLWEVNDLAASEFMDYFYTELLKNKRSVYQSYRYAQETMAKNHPGDPYRWAAFVLME